MPLEKHVGLAYKCTRQLTPFFEAVIKGEWDAAAAIRREIENLEHEADAALLMRRSMRS